MNGTWHWRMSSFCQINYNLLTAKYTVSICHTKTGRINLINPKRLNRHRNRKPIISKNVLLTVPLGDAKWRKTEIVILKKQRWK